MRLNHINHAINQYFQEWLTIKEILWPQGLKKYPWLTICTTKKKVYCFYCRYADNPGMLMFSSKAESTFTKVGFNNKKALENHTHCNAHSEAILKWQMLPATPIVDHLSNQVKKDQEERRQALLKQLHCLRYFLRQGLAIRARTYRN